MKKVIHAKIALLYWVPGTPCKKGFLMPCVILEISE